MSRILIANPTCAATEIYDILKKSSMDDERESNSNSINALFDAIHKNKKPLVLNNKPSPPPVKPKNTEGQTDSSPNKWLDKRYLTLGIGFLALLAGSVATTLSLLSRDPKPETGAETKEAKREIANHSPQTQTQVITPAARPEILPKPREEPPTPPPPPEPERETIPEPPPPPERSPESIAPTAEDSSADRYEPPSPSQEESQ